MADAGDDDDLTLTRAASSLLADLERSLPRLLYKRKRDDGRLIAHTTVRRADLAHVLKLIEPIQGDPQLLDAHLKSVVPSIADALSQRLSHNEDNIAANHISILEASSALIYTLCKVRGRKVVSGLLPNEPHHLELVTGALESHIEQAERWQVQFTLLLWLSHLLLAPFALATISSATPPIDLTQDLKIDARVPSLARRCMNLALETLGSPSIAQSAAAILLARLSTRPDMHTLGLAENLIAYLLPKLSTTQDTETSIHTKLGTLRFLIAVGKSTDATSLFPTMFTACASHIDSDQSSITDNAMGRKLVLKTMSTLILTSLRSSRYGIGSAVLLTDSDALETTIEHHLRCLADPESLVRHAAAKAISNIVLGLDQSMCQDVIDAVIGNIGDETPADGQLQTADAFAWHGNILTLSYALFKRSVSIEQLPTVLRMLLLASSFEQRTAGGAVTGTGVRDAANFGLWSLARRFTTAELSRVDSPGHSSVFRLIATQLLQAACLDPVGNIGRGSSAALQELVGRHPDRIPNGILLVQVVDYLAVGLRQRAMTEVAANAAQLDVLYWDAITSGLAGWRGLGSADAISRTHAAGALPQRYSQQDFQLQALKIKQLAGMLATCASNEYDLMHGLILCMATWLSQLRSSNTGGHLGASLDIDSLWTAIEGRQCFANAFSLRAIRTELTTALTRFMTEYCTFKAQSGESLTTETQHTLTEFYQRLLDRHEEAIHRLLLPLTRSLLDLKVNLDELHKENLISQLLRDSAKPTVLGAGRAFALAVVATFDPNSLTDIIPVICTVCGSVQVDWRVIGFKALAVVIHSTSGDRHDIQLICVEICKGTRDYTIDQRGDIGSLVRLQAIQCAEALLSTDIDEDLFLPVQAEILRLSLERLNRVRASAAHCRTLLPGRLGLPPSQDVESEEYFSLALAPLWQADATAAVRTALLEGVTSCAGSAAEHLIHNARAVMLASLSHVTLDILTPIMQDFTALLKASSTSSSLDLLAFFLQARILQRLSDGEYKWRNLLAIVQRAHYKSTDINKILTAVSIYAFLAEIDSIRSEVLKKLLSMVKTNPFPKVRAAVADTIFMITSMPDMKKHDWSRPASANKEAVAMLEQYL